MLITAQLERKFLFEQNGVWVKLDDPDPYKSPDEVLDFYAHTYPVLVTAKAGGVNIKDDEMQYEFLATIGTKG